MVPIVLHGTLGRPRFSIPRNQLAYLLEAQFSVPKFLVCPVATCMKLLLDETIQFNC